LHRKVFRKNIVDGWGVIHVLYRNYTCLRVHTDMYQNDSVYIDSTKKGYVLPQVHKVEYKWLANYEGIPMVDIAGIVKNDTFRVDSISFFQRNTHDAIIGIKKTEPI